MEDPVSDIPNVIRTLCQAPPSIQQRAIETYFTPTSSFIHPFCRTGSFQNSRWLIQCIYRWYKIMSPRIDVDIKSVAFDRDAMLLYVSMRQIFRIQFLPFYKASVDLTTVLHLTTDPSPSSPYAVEPVEYKPSTTRYYIQSQNDLYQTSEWIKFLLPWLDVGTIAVVLWQLIATFFCVIGAMVGWPITWIEENFIGGNPQQKIKDVTEEDW